jgi:hypothetical protein
VALPEAFDKKKFGVRQKSQEEKKKEGKQKTLK